MLQFILLILVLALIVGIVYAGMVKIVIVGILALGVIFVLGFLTWGIIHEARKSRPFDPQNPSAEEFRAVNKAAANLLAKQAAEGKIDYKPSVAQAETQRHWELYPVFMTVNAGDETPREVAMTSGRFFRPEDMTQPLMLVNDAIVATSAETYPLGKGFRIGGTTFTVIGVFKGSGPLYGRKDIVLVPRSFSAALGFPEASLKPAVEQEEFISRHIAADEAPKITDDELRQLRKMTGLE